MNKKAKSIGGWLTFIIFIAVIIFLILLTKNKGNMDIVLKDILFWQWGDDMGGPKTFATIIVLLAALLFLILVYYYSKASGSTDLFIGGMKMLFTNNVSSP